MDFWWYWWCCWDMITSCMETCLIGCVLYTYECTVWSFITVLSMLNKGTTWMISCDIFKETWFFSLDIIASFVSELIFIISFILISKLLINNNLRLIVASILSLIFALFNDWNICACSYFFIIFVLCTILGLSQSTGD